MNQSSEWLMCPRCGKKSQIKVNYDTVLLRFPLYCPKCKQETRIDYLNRKVFVSKEPVE